MDGRNRGFTIVELLLVIAILGILAAIVIVAYNGIQDRARNAIRIDAIKSAQRFIEANYVITGEFPKTTTNPHSNWKAADVYTDDGCSNGSSQPDWIPGVTVSLPQSDANATGVDGLKGCYLYVSDGQEYVISAWNMVKKPQTSTLYRRLGFREFQSSSSTQFIPAIAIRLVGLMGGMTVAKIITSILTVFQILAIATRRLHQVPD